MNRLIHISILLTLLSSCSSTMVPQGLYTIEEPESDVGINGFTATTIFDESIDKSFWVSPETHCVTADKEPMETYSGDIALRVTWDKVTGGCEWIGIGFGWNNWQPKDMNEVVDVASIQMKVKSVKGTFKNFPVAFAIEDYTGVQTYYGFEPSLVEGEFTDTAWQTVTIPLSKFPFDAKNANLGIVKQFLIQLEGDGDIYLDDIKIIANEKI